MEKILMSKKSDLSIQEAFDLFIRKCRIKNLTDLSISSYEKKMVQFYEFIDKSEPITSVTRDFFHPFIEDCLREFAIVEPTITHEEAEKLLQMIREWEEREGIEYSE